MNLSLEQGGSTDRNYVDAEGKKGNYLTFAKWFRREGQACGRCGAEVVKTRVAGRGTCVLDLSDGAKMNYLITGENIYKRREALKKITAATQLAPERYDGQS